MGSKKGLVLFAYDKPNRYSWSIIMGYIESDPILMENYTFLPIPFQLYHSHKHLDYFAKINFLEYDFIVIAYSLLSVQIELFSKFLTSFPRFFQQFHNQVITIAGGPHVSADPESLFSYGLNYLVIGEGEEPFAYILHQVLHLESNSREANLLENSKKIPVGVYDTKINSSKIIPAEFTKFGDFPSFSEKFRLFSPIEISRGCPFSCKFCQTGSCSKKMRHVPLPNIINWIKRATEIKIDKVWFLTPNAFAYGSKNGITPNPDILHSLLSQIYEIKSIKGIYFGTFPSEVRPESVSYEVMDAVSPFIANKKLLIGAQTASNRLLKSIARGHTIEQVISAVEIINQYNILTEIDFIFGLPEENKEDISANIAFFNKVLDNEIKNVRIHAHTFMPLPGTPFEHEKRGKIHPEIEKIVGKLAKYGKAYGEYQAQAGKIKTRYSNE